MLSKLRQRIDNVFQLITVTLLFALALIVITAVFFRYSGHSLVWYDEVASVLLVWITLTGSVLGVFRNAHLAFYGLLNSLPMSLRKLVFALLELCFIAVFVFLGWGGYVLLTIFEGEALISLPSIPLSFTYSIIFLAPGFIILARLLTLSERYGQLIAGIDSETLEIQKEISKSVSELHNYKSKTAETS